MSHALHNATDAQLADSVEANLFALFRAIATLPGSAIVETERISYHHASPSAPMFKSVWQTRLQPGEIDAAIDAALDWYKARNSPFAAWWFNDRTPPELTERLEARGFELDYLAPALALDMDSAVYNPPDGLTIVEARDPAALADWTTAFKASYVDYHMDDLSAHAWEYASLAWGSDTPWRLYVGYLDGQPVAVNLLLNGGGVAGLYCIGTAPEVRGRGIGTAITLKPLLDARAEGYQYGVLFASELGMPVYMKMGFREVGTKIGRYIWMNTAL